MRAALSHDSTPTTDVLIVGAGPVGLTLAIGLARAGVDCRIIERDDAFRTAGVRGKGVNPRTLEVFDDLGVVARILDRGVLDLKVRAYEGTRLVQEFDPGATRPTTPDRPYAGMLMIAQHHTEAVLRDRLAEYGVKVETGSELTDCTQDTGHAYAQDAAGIQDTDGARDTAGVLATVRQGDRTAQLRARFLVGCDGGRSTVRKLAGIPFLGETWEEERFIMASMDLDGLDPDHMHLWNHPKFGAGAMAIVPMRQDGKWAVHAAVEPDEHGELPAPTLETFRRLFAERAGLPGVRMHEPIWSTVWRPTVRLVERYRDGRVLLAGDAAHCQSAAGGQGMNTGIQDAHNLAWKLAAVLRGAPAELLDSYQEERRPIALAGLAATSAHHKAAFRGDGATVLTEQFRTLAVQGTDLTGLSIDYRGGPLGRDLDEATGIRAGDRAPDAPCTTADGTPVRLFDLFRGPHFTLLAFGDHPAPADQSGPADPAARSVLQDLPGLRVAAVRDPDGHAARAYGLRGEAVVLVRPDGYVSLTGASVDRSTLTEHLRAFAV
ncbi:FAD-dependent monooxygenase [Kitasatospora sp. NPDC098652]|uniref:FAD-dependent monooxygenase n=1 Tax=Kitasatospora sp. NPDC098652 TaxID=3364095 RepID=UPI0038184165